MTTVDRDSTSLSVHLGITYGTTILVFPKDTIGTALSLKSTTVWLYVSALR